MRGKGRERSLKSDELDTKHDEELTTTVVRSDAVYDPLGCPTVPALKGHSSAFLYTCRYPYREIILDSSQGFCTISSTSTRDPRHVSRCGECCSS